MSDEILLREERLKTLDEGEIRLLFYLFHGKKFVDLQHNKKLKTDVSIKTLKGRLTSIYKKLEIDAEKDEKRNELKRQYRSIVFRIITNEEDLDLWIEGDGIEGRFTKPEEEQEPEEVEEKEEEEDGKEPEEIEEKEEEEETEKIEYKQPDSNGIKVEHDTGFEPPPHDRIEEGNGEEPPPPEEPERDLEIQPFLRWVGIVGAIIIIISVAIWLVSRCSGENPPPPTPVPTRIPTAEPTRTETSPPVGQVDPPADTAVPIPPTETFTPTITLTPTLTPTPTITHTPTITPTWVIPGNDNLPLTFEGTYKVPSYYPFDMKLYIEEKSGDNVGGKFQWPDRNNRFQGWEGIIVHDFGDVIEQSKWEQVEGFGSEGTYIKETRKWVISAGGGIDGNYYFYISPEGRLTGLWFRRDDLTPEATIDLDFSE